MLMKTTQRLLTLAAALLLTASNLSAQETPTPEFPSYYAAADGKKGAELKTALCGIIRANLNDNVVSYTPGLWDAYPKTDAKPNDPTKVWDMYSSTSNFTFGAPDQDSGSGGSTEGDKYNREHSFPREWFGGAVAPMNTDLFHVYPTDKLVNNKRSSLPYGENNGESYKSNGGFSKIGKCTLSGSGAVNCFEPNDIYKGDFARTYFYMVTCYENEVTSWNNGALGVTLDGSKYPAFTTWQLNMLMKWAQNDPVDNPIAKETPRNNEVANIQKNRNPFIDYPGLEEYIWGSYMDVPFSYNNYQQPTAITTIRTDRTMHNDVMYNMAGQVVDKSFKGLVIMNGKKYLNR